MWPIRCFIYYASSKTSIYINCIRSTWNGNFNGIVGIGQAEIALPGFVGYLSLVVPLHYPISAS